MQPAAHSVRIRDGLEGKGTDVRDEPLSLRGAPVKPLPRPNRVWSPGRTCGHDGCTTKLSIYNRAQFCWVHEPLKFHLARGKRRSSKQAA